ncbi:hypothetical protein KVR01_004824 [Diaporthe batatas]|uniref:uncharacterized protein n=1 Tax=Diaporthe batatas TaxID=748121 RepID=UPI001D05194B|nr:uncharacterized protein KVR01_004824 [Diaporthe batatas]KAG8166272.1 hypothetical protein KVR01_004824 [Diaporthe batatas]
MAAEHEENSQPPIRSYIEAFRPLVPTEDTGSTARLQHIFVKNGSPASFGHVVSEQWHTDHTNGRSTWAVVDSNTECLLLATDLVDGATNIPGQKVDTELVRFPSADGKIPGSGIVIMSFRELVTTLSACRGPGPVWQWDAALGNPTVVMNFAWGDMSFDMAFACPLLAKVIEATTGIDAGGLMACTVSSENKRYFGKEWKLVETQEITSLTRGDRPRPTFRGSDKWTVNDGQERMFDEIKGSLSDILEHGSRAREQRSLLLAEPRVADLLGSGARAVVEVGSCETLRSQEMQDIDISLGGSLTYLGQLRMISDVVIYPYFSGYTDSDGQLVAMTAWNGVPRSQAEINYYSRCNQESDTQPRVHILTSEKRFRELPTHCETSPAHTLHLGRLLLCCKFVWPELPLADVPVLLPEYDAAVMLQLMYLRNKGLIARPAVATGEVNRPGQAGKPELYRMMDLTALGSKTAVILLHGVHGLTSAHLLAQLMDTPEEQRTTATVEAFLAMSVLSEPRDLSRRTPLCGDISVTAGKDHDRTWYDTNLKGIASGNAGRGPVWLAAGLWQELMHNYEFRAPLGQSNRRQHEYPPAVFNNGSIKVDVEETLDWDDRLVVFSKILTDHTGIPAVIELKDTPLTAPELLAVEVALVRAFMDRIMIMEDHGKDFKACDMASGLQLGRPVKEQEDQIWFEDCESRDRLKSGLTFPVIFCVYSHLIEAVNNGLVTMHPVDVTVVSARAVRLALEGTMAHVRVRTSLSTARLLRERARQASLGQT